MQYFISFICGALWTCSLTMEKHFIAQRKPLRAGLCGFVIAIFSILLFRHYTKQDDYFEILFYALGCGASTFLVLTLLIRSK